MRNLLVGGLRTDVQFKIVNLDSEQLHFLGKTEPVFYSTDNTLPNDFGPVTLFPNEKPFENLFVHRLSQCIAGYVELGRQGYFIREQCAGFILFGGYQLSENVFRLEVQRARAIVIDIHGWFIWSITKIAKNQAIPRPKGWIIIL